MAREVNSIGRADVAFRGGEKPTASPRSLAGVGEWRLMWRRCGYGDWERMEELWCQEPWGFKATVSACLPGALSSVTNVWMACGC